MFKNRYLQVNIVNGNEDFTIQNSCHCQCCNWCKGEHDVVFP